MYKLHVQQPDKFPLPVEVERGLSYTECAFCVPNNKIRNKKQELNRDAIGHYPN